MSRKMLKLRLILWFIGIGLALFSTVVFYNENDFVWDLARIYNEIICVTSFIPIVLILTICDYIRNTGAINTNRSFWQFFFQIGILLIAFIIYICVWVMCSGGI